MNDIIEKLLKSPESFDFCQAVRILEIALNLNHERLRFKHNASLAFPTSEISKISTVESRWEINTNIMGLIGPTGVLPNHHTALIINRLQHKDFALRDFLDIFQHRVVSFFYFSWKKNHYYNDKESAHSTILLSLMGQGTPSLQNRENISDEMMLYYVPYFSRQRKSVLGLELILTDYFNSPVKVKTYQQKWMEISDQEKSRLSKNKFNQLGVNAICGQRQLQYQYHFCLDIGPLDIEKFMSFLPDQQNISLLIALTRRYLGVEYTFDMRLILRAKSVPHCQLGKIASARLGWNTWLKVREFASDANNTVLSII